MTKKLSASLEDYLEAIAELCAHEGHAHSKEIAEKLSVKMPSVTEALRQLVDMGYIIYNTHYPVQLTSAGRAVAEEIVKLRDEYAPIVPMQVVFRDNGFNDVTKTNALQILKQAGFEEKSIQTI
mgnify:CR=1 FL=1